MANSELPDLTENTDPIHEDLLYSVDDPGGTPLDRKITIKNLLSLGLVPTIKAAAEIPYTAVEGELVLATSAGADETVTLPASSKAGDRVGVYYEAQTAGDDLIVGRNSNNINGAASDRTLTIANEFEIYEFDGTEWWVIGQHLIPHSCKLRQTSAQSNLTQATFNQITFDASDWDNAALGSLTNEDITIRRAGRYYTGIQVGVSGVAGNRVASRTSKNNDATPLFLADWDCQDNGNLKFVSGIVLDLSEGDTVELWINPVEDGTSDTIVTDTSQQCCILVKEVLDQVT